MATRYSKATRWMKQFVDLAHDLVPIDRIQTVKIVTVPLEKRILTAACLLWDKGGYYAININLQKSDWEVVGENLYRKKKYKKDSLSSTLDSLAHELAHIKFKDHHPNHLVLQARILMRFAKHLKKLGVKDTSQAFDSEIDTSGEEQ
jgi:hypothetical protein